MYGDNFTDVKERYKSSYFSLWNWWRIKEEFSFLPFNVSCLGIASDKHYTVEFKIKSKYVFVSKIFLNILLISSCFVLVNVNMVTNRRFSNCMR